MPIGFHWFEFVPLVLLWLWGVLAIPFGWLAILAYVVTRAVTSAQPR
jgi:hypothetical protein